MLHSTRLVRLQNAPPAGVSFDKKVTLAGNNDGDGNNININENVANDGDDDHYYESPPGPNKIDNPAWIPTALYHQAWEAYNEKFTSNNNNNNSGSTVIDSKGPSAFLAPTACPTHVRNLQLFGRVPTIYFLNDPMMPGFCKDHDYDLGEYVSGRVQLLDANDNWNNVVFLVNEGDGDCNTGYCGGTYLIGIDGDNDSDRSCSLTPLAWIRSVGDTESSVEQAKTLPTDSLESFDRLSEETVQFDASMLLDEYDDEEERTCHRIK